MDVRRFVYLLVILFPFPLEAARFSIEDAPPAGFEGFSTAQTTQVDIYYGKKPVGSVMATFDVDSFEFTHPENVVGFIQKSLVNPDAVIAALKGNIDTHVELLCPQGQTVGCGVLRPEVAGVIFDESRFRVDLFVSPDYQKTQTVRNSVYLPPPTGGLSSVSLFRVDMLGGSSTENFQQINAQTTVAFRQTHLVERISLDSENGADLRELSLAHVRNDWLYGAGMLQSSGLNASLISTRNILGARLASSLLMRTDLSIVSGSPIILFLEERSRVDMLLEERVIRTGFYEAGNHQLDTSSLPDGSHSIQLKITDSRGERIEHRYFTRSQALPPRKHPQHFIELGGVIEDDSLSPLPNASNDRFVNVGTRIRLRDRLGAEFQWIKSDYSDSIAQAGLTYLSPKIGQNLNLLVADNKLIGQSYSLALQYTGISTNLGYRHLEESVSGDWQNTEMFAIKPGEEFNIGFSSKVLDGSLVGSFRRTSTVNGDEVDDYLLSYRRAILRRSGSQADFSTSLSSRDGEASVSIGISYNRSRKTQRNSVSFSAAKKTTDDPEMLLNASSINKLIESREATVSASAFTSLSKNIKIAGVGVNGLSRYGSAFFEVNADIQEDDHPVNYSLGIESAVLHSGNTLSVASSTRKTAGVIVEVEGNQTGQFDVLVDDRVQGRITAGRKVSIPLSVYKSYDISLREAGKDFYQVDSEPRALTAFPGTVNKLSWDVRKLIVLIAQAVDPVGRPISNARFTNLKEFSTTDEDGWFQVEISNEKSLQLENSDSQSCRITVPENTDNEDVLVLDTLQCI